jgi:excisionase family DNA binding protein
VTVRTAHALAFRSVGYVYKPRLANSPWAWFPYLKEKMPRALDSVARLGRDATSAGALVIRRLEQFLRTTDGAIGAIHAPYWCEDNVGYCGYAVEALWKNICKHNSSAPVTHDCYFKLFYLQGRELAPRDWTVMLDEARPSVMFNKHLDDVRPLGYVAKGYRTAASTRESPPKEITGLPARLPDQEWPATSPSLREEVTGAMKKGPKPASPTQTLPVKVLTKTEACKYLNASHSAINGMLKRREIPAFRVGSDWRFNVEDLERWMRKSQGSAR